MKTLSSLKQAQTELMKFKKWCISTVDTVKEAPAKEKAAEKEEATEKKGLFGKKKKDEESK